MSIRVSSNFIEVIRPRCNVDMQFQSVIHTLVIYQILYVSTTINHEHVAWSAYGVGLFRQKYLEWKEVTNLHWIRIGKPRNPPGSLTNGFTNGQELIEALLFKLLKSLMKLRKIYLKCIIL